LGHLALSWLLDRFRGITCDASREHGLFRHSKAGSV
jgi:hypothetical protein